MVHQKDEKNCLKSARRGGFTLLTISISTGFIVIRRDRLSSSFRRGCTTEMPKFQAGHLLNEYFDVLISD